MGKVRILSGGEDGRYTVEPVLDEAVYTALRQQAEDQEAFAATLVAELDAEIIEIEAEQDDAIQRVDNATNAYVQAHRDGEDISGLLADLNDAQANLAHISGQLSIRRAQRSLAESRRFEAQKTIDALDAEANPPPREAWCADFTEDAEGEIASIEVPGEPQEPIIIYPQDLDQGHHQRERDGLLTPRAWQTGPQVYYNAAVLPGWQRHRPTYRIGAILSVDSETDTADVQLDPAQSSAQGLPINTQPHLSGIPVEYMDCNSVAFEEGDRVVVQFHQTEEPKVIGFEKEPKRCDLPLYVVANFQEGFQKGSQMLLKLSPDLGSVEQTLTIPGTTETAVSYSQTNAPIWSLAVAGARGNTRHAVVFGAQLRFSSGVTHSAHDYQSVSSDGERFIALLIAGSEPFYRYEFYDLDGGFLYGCALQNPPNGFADDLQLPNSEASPDRMFSIWRTANFRIAPWEYNQCDPIAPALDQSEYNGHIAATATRRAAVRYQSGAGVALDLFSTGMTHHSSLTVPGYSPSSQTVMSPAFRPRSLTVAGHTHHPSFETFENVFIQVDGVVFPQREDPFEFGAPKVVNLTEAHGFTRVNHATINKTAMIDLGGL